MESIATNIESISKKKPHTEIAIISRTYVDHNREEACAFEKSSLKAKEAYMDYHKEFYQKLKQCFLQKRMA